MNRLATKTSLSEPRRELLELMQRLNFGRIENLLIRDGEPVFNPAPRIIKDIKIGGENKPRPELDRSDFLLRDAVVELFDYFNHLANSAINVIHVKAGLPFRVVVERPLAKED